MDSCLFGGYRHTLLRFPLLPTAVTQLRHLQTHMPGGLLEWEGDVCW